MELLTIRKINETTFETTNKEIVSLPQLEERRKMLLMEIEISTNRLNSLNSELTALNSLLASYKVATTVAKPISELQAIPVKQ